MPREIFLLPMIGDGTSGNSFRPRYASDTLATTEFPVGLGVPFGQGNIRYSRTSVAVTMIDGPQAYLDEVAAQPDADRWVSEADLDTEIPGQRVNQLRTTLEDLNVPGTWISANDNWRETIRTVTGMFLFSQRHEGLTEPSVGFFEWLEGAGFGLNTRWSQLGPIGDPEDEDFFVPRDNIARIALSFDPDWVPPSNQTQVRAILRDFADFFQGKEIIIGGLEL